MMAQSLESRAVDQTKTRKTLKKSSLILSVFTFKMSKCPLWVSLSGFVSLSLRLKLYKLLRNYKEKQKFQDKNEVFWISVIKLYILAVVIVCKALESE